MYMNKDIRSLEVIRIQGILFLVFPFLVHTKMRGELTKVIYVASILPGCCGLTLEDDESDYTRHWSGIFNFAYPEITENFLEDEAYSFWRFIIMGKLCSGRMEIPL